MENLVQNIFLTENPNALFLVLNSLNNKQHVNSVTSDLIDVEILNEIKNILSCGSTSVYFGKTLRDIKIIIQDHEWRKHEIYLQYTAPKKILISDVKLPNSTIQSREYGCIKDIIESFSQYVNNLSGYFHELENMDEFCKIMEPINASFKDDYRRIYLDDRTWLHVEVTPEGLATNIHLVGQSEHWHNKLQSGLLNWDHDKNIVDNITTIFEFNEFPQPASKISEHSNINREDTMVDTIVCGICLCADLPEAPGMPLPICQNSYCGVYYHRSCLYQWLVACAGSRAPAFGVANGACPTCLQPITCSEKDN